MMQRHHSLKHLPIVASLFLGKYFCTRSKDSGRKCILLMTQACVSSRTSFSSLGFTNTSALVSFRTKSYQYKPRRQINILLQYGERLTNFATFKISLGIYLSTD